LAQSGHVSASQPHCSHSLRARCQCGLGRLHTEHCANEERRVNAESGGDGCKETGDPEVEPVDRDERAAGARDHAHCVGDTAANALADVEKSQAQPEADVGRADDAQVERAKARDLGVVAEQADPQARLERDDRADRSAHHRHRRRAGPRDLAGTAILLRAPVRPNHRDHRGAEAERDRLHDVFKARAHGVAERGVAPQLSGDSRQYDDREIGDGYVDQAGHAYLEDVGKPLPARSHPAEVQPHDRARTQVPDHDGAAAGERNHQSQARAGRTERRHRSEAEDQDGRNRDVRHNGADQHGRGEAHVASAAHRIAQQIAHTDDDGAAQRHVGVGERVGEHFVASAHRAEQEGRAQQQHGGEDRGDGERQEKRVEDERVGAIAAPRAQRACDGRRDADAHAAVCRLQDHHHPGKRQRGTGERIGADAPEKETVERDHAGEREQSEDVRRRQTQQGGQDSTFEQQLGARGRGQKARAFAVPMMAGKSRRFGRSWRAPRPQRGGDLSSAWTGASWEPGRLRVGARLASTYSVVVRTAKDHFSGRPENISCTPRDRWPEPVA
jgi:hypothetical protein